MRHSLCIDMPPTACASVRTGGALSPSFLFNLFCFLSPPPPPEVQGSVVLLVISDAQAAEGASVRFDFLEPLVTVQQIYRKGTPCY
jgi:hypothetical protein